jgi:hypothetical protein
VYNHFDGKRNDCVGFLEFIVFQSYVNRGKALAEGIVAITKGDRKNGCS